MGTQAVWHSLWVWLCNRKAKAEYPRILHYIDYPDAVKDATAQQPDTEDSWPAEIPFPNAGLELIKPDERRQVFSVFDDLAFYAYRCPGLGGGDFV